MPANETPNADGTVDDHRGERRTERRVHLSEAADLLSVSKYAVRMWVKRGTLRSEKGEGGRVYVWVNVNPDGDPNGVHPQGEVDPYWELIDELHDRVRSLEEANRENRRIIATLTQRIPAIEASSEPPEGPQNAREEPERATPVRYRRPSGERPPEKHKKVAGARLKNTPARLALYGLIDPISGPYHYSVGSG